MLASQRLFEAAARDGVRVVFASSSSVYGEAERYPTPEDAPPVPLSPYGITKLTCEHLARAYARSFGLDAVVLRYFNAFGPRQRPDMAFSKVVDALATGEPFDMYGDGEQSRGWTYVDDVVDATILAMESGSGTYNVGGGVEASLREAIGVLERLGGAQLELREHPPVPGDQRRTNADTTRHPLRARLGAGDLARGRLAGPVGMGFGYSQRAMSPDSEPSSPTVELEAETERSTSGVRADRSPQRWWLLVVGVVLGALIGFLFSLSAGSIYKATAQLYLGQPLAPDSAAAVTTSPTTLGLVQAFVTSEDTIGRPPRSPASGRRSSAEHHGPADSRRLEHEAGLSGTAALDSGHGLLAREDGGGGERSRAVGGRRGRHVHEHEDRDARKAARLHRHAARHREPPAQRPRAPRRRRSSPTRASAPRRSSSRSRTSTAEITLAEQRQATLEINRFNTRRDLARQGHRAGRITAHAVAVRTEPTSRRTSVLVGAFIGLLLGIVAALLWDPVAGRMARRLHPPSPCSTARP